MSLPDNPPPPPAGSGVPRPRTSTGNQRVVSANRSEGSSGPKDLKMRLKSEAENVGLNALAVTKETWKDIKGSNRFFKYKVLIVALWAMLSLVSLFIARPQSTSAGNKLQAQLYSPPSGGNVFMIKNEGKTPWLNVNVVVNRDYLLATPRVDPQADITFNPKQLTGPNGRVAPPELVIQHIEIRTDSGRSVLLQGGVEVK